MAENKNNNKSLFLYTGLIFIVAVLLIILSFFGQMNLQKNQPITDETEEQIQTNNGITERAAVLSEENKNLIEENNKLKSDNEALMEYQTNNNILLAANGYFTLGSNDKALEMLLAVNYETLTSDQQMIYDSVKEGIEAAEKNN